MKTAFIADIHGNATALQSVLAHIDQQQVDQIYVLGDICYRGPQPQRSLQLVRALGVPVIKGNADEWVVRGLRQGEVPEKALDMMNKERDWAKEHLSDEQISYLSQLPEQLHVSVGQTKIHAFHATPGNLFDVVLPATSDAQLQQKMMSDAQADVYVYGHIHLPYIRSFGGKTIVNTGSVGLPFDGHTTSSYLLIEETQGHMQLSIQRVAYDIETVIRDVHEQAYPNAGLLEQVLRRGISPFSL